MIILYRLFSNLTRFSPSSISASCVLPISVTQSVMADDERRRNLFVTTIVASEWFNHVQLNKDNHTIKKTTVLYENIYIEKKKDLFH